MGLYDGLALTTAIFCLVLAVVGVVGFYFFFIRGHTPWYTAWRRNSRLDMAIGSVVLVLWLALFGSGFTLYLHIALHPLPDADVADGRQARHQSDLEFEDAKKRTATKYGRTADHNDPEYQQLLFGQPGLIADHALNEYQLKMLEVLLKHQPELGKEIAERWKVDPKTLKPLEKKKE